ncbi:hypothetical protein [Desulfobotulus sp.]|uniref:hypothetical protein n=1 Tax=Desulfobotulus sp. TaxID=1940337 RepID=UPI002A36157C|nr:hypothetical protein [Desulfobotulus sp.]MDY0163733.1 hypothetical protein [Desulfobotulus sp.]
MVGKKQWCFRMVCLWVFLPQLVFGEGDWDFREVRWGMGRLAVMAAEKATPEPVRGPYLSYKLWMLDGEVFLRYRFVENRLVEARYVFSVKGREGFSTLVDLLRDKYGEGVPLSDAPEEGGGWTWETQRTHIHMDFSPGGHVRIVYAGKEVSNWLHEKQEAALKREHARVLSLF